MPDRMGRWDAWATRQVDRYERFVERRFPRWGRWGYAAFLRRSADDTEHFRPRGAARDRRRAARVELEALEIAFRMGSAQPPHRRDPR